MEMNAMGEEERAEGEMHTLPTPIATASIKRSPGFSNEVVARLANMIRMMESDERDNLLFQITAQRDLDKGRVIVTQSSLVFTFKLLDRVDPTHNRTYNAIIRYLFEMSVSMGHLNASFHHSTLSWSKRVEHRYLSRKVHPMFNPWTSVKLWEKFLRQLEKSDGSTTTPHTQRELCATIEDGHLVKLFMLPSRYYPILVTGEYVGLVDQRPITIIDADTGRSVTEKKLVVFAFHFKSSGDMGVFTQFTHGDRHRASRSAEHMTLELLPTGNARLLCMSGNPKFPKQIVHAVIPLPRMERAIHQIQLRHQYVSTTWSPIIRMSDLWLDFVNKNLEDAAAIQPPPIVALDRLELLPLVQGTPTDMWVDVLSIVYAPSAGYKIDRDAPLEGSSLYEVRASSEDQEEVVEQPGEHPSSPTKRARKDRREEGGADVDRLGPLKEVAAVTYYTPTELVHVRHDGRHLSRKWLSILEGIVSPGHQSSPMHVKIGDALILRNRASSSTRLVTASPMRMKNLMGKLMDTWHTLAALYPDGKSLLTFEHVEAVSDLSLPWYTVVVLECTFTFTVPGKSPADAARELSDLKSTFAEEDLEMDELSSPSYTEETSGWYTYRCPTLIGLAVDLRASSTHSWEAQPLFVGINVDAVNTGIEKNLQSNMTVVGYCLPPTSRSTKFNARIITFAWATIELIFTKGDAYTQAMTTLEHTYEHLHPINEYAQVNLVSIDTQKLPANDENTYVTASIENWRMLDGLFVVHFCTTNTTPNQEDSSSSHVLSFSTFDGDRREATFRSLVDDSALHIMHTIKHTYNVQNDDIIQFFYRDGKIHYLTGLVSDAMDLEDPNPHTPLARYALACIELDVDAPLDTIEEDDIVPPPSSTPF